MMFFTWNFNCLITHSFLLIKYNTDKIINFFLRTNEPYGHFWLTLYNSQMSVLKNVEEIK